VSSPTKVVEYLALGLPVVASDIPDQRRLLAECGGGRCVAFDATALAEALHAALADPHTGRTAAQRARAAVLARRGYDAIAARVASVLQSLAPASAQPLTLERPWRPS
jgi:glycosyltransferase involved in cell wall biosynthesis